MRGERVAGLDRPVIVGVAAVRVPAATLAVAAEVAMTYSRLKQWI